MEDLSEVITCARFHPAECHLLAYSTSRGLIRLCDMRVGALCDSPILALEDPRLTQNLGFFADIIASLSDFRFGHSGHHLLARDYLTLKVWDIRMTDRPCEVYPVHEPFRSQLCMLYENDAIFDKFLCSWSSDDRYLLTGSYGSLFRIFDRTNGSDWIYDLSDFNAVQNSDFSADRLGYLLPKRFLSPEDPLGNCLGLTAVCVASIQSLDTFLLHTDSSSGDGGSSSSSPGSCFSDCGTNEDSRSPLARDHSTDSRNSATRRANEDKNSPPTGSKRRKQVLSAPTIRASELDENDTDQTYPARRRRRRKRKLYSSSNSNDLVPAACTTSHNGLSRTSGMSLNSFSTTEQRIRRKLARRQLLAGDYSSKENPALPDLQQLDCQRKLLHLAWHPREIKLAAISGNQMFLVNGSRNSVPSTSIDNSRPCGWHLGSPDDLEKDLDVEDAVDDLNWVGDSSRDLTELKSTTSFELPLNAKAPKRPRHRSHNQTTSQVDSNELVHNSGENTLPRTNVSIPADGLPVFGEMLPKSESHIEPWVVPEARTDTDNGTPDSVEQSSSNFNDPSTLPEMTTKSNG
ncbi:Serine/threonine-protein phosphatase 2A 55 kDa regulatory subunit B [Fasciola hepatica]|uniref:Serine/threonine-protein phosphatase 2A 55 kDa regulatory subunit B n=1 Tax=Fasciola hepatica TaxID=6192 RepID=A0A4E0QZB3_FASHE|nr:Serine/threonine-protein phosphatase 2A 55 kDa regulatory subunit B [Fasciola hepatica]